MFTSEDIDDVISRFYIVVCTNNRAYPVKNILTVAWRYEFYFLAVKKAIFYSLAVLFRKMLILPLENKFISSRRRVKFSPYLKRFSCEKACKHFRECS